MSETQFYCHAKAKKPSAEDGLGPGLQTCSLALVPVTLIGDSRLCLAKGNVKALNLLQSRMKENAGLAVKVYA